MKPLGQVVQNDLAREVFPGIYCIKVPLTGNPLKFVNSYFIRGAERSLLIDVGFNREECFEAVKQALDSLDVDLNTVDLFLTHGHADHCGAVPFYEQFNPTIYAGFESFSALREMVAYDVAGFHGWMGAVESSCLKQHIDTYDTFPLPEFKKDERLFRNLGIPGTEYPITLMHDGDTLQVGDYTFTLISTLGHWPDHLCLFDKEKRVLITGDQVLNQITPVISTFDVSANVLRDFLNSLDDLDKLPVTIGLGAHRNIISDVHNRIKELKAHHEHRLSEMVELVADGKNTIEQIVSNATWNNPIPNWYEWPNNMKYFSLGETIAHMVYLVDAGVLTMEIIEGIPYYALAEKTERYIKNN